MILAVDPGIGACGWAIVQPRPCRVIELGVWTSKPDPALAKSTDRARRVNRLSIELGRIRAAFNCTVIAAEGMLGFGTVNAVIPQALVWGALSMHAALMQIDLVEVIAKDWQHAITDSDDKVDYAAVERVLARYVGKRLEAIKPNLRTHALDAVGVGLYTAMRPVTVVAKAVRS